jgi:uncharacterized protein
LLCILLHASFTTPAQDHLLSEDSMTVDVTLLATYLGAAAVMIIASRGRLGLPRANPGDSLPNHKINRTAAR